MYFNVLANIKKTNTRKRYHSKVVEFLIRSFMQFAFILRFNMYKNLIDKSISIVLWDKFYKLKRE